MDEKEELLIKIIEKDKGPVVRWLANRALDLAAWLIKLASPYGHMYSLTFKEPEEDPLMADLEEFYKWINEQDKDTGAF